MVNFVCQPCGIFEGISHHQEDEASVGLGYRIKKLVISNFMGMVRSVSVIFDTGDTYSCFIIIKTL